MNRLPNEVLTNIYQFDSTYRNIYDNIIQNLTKQDKLKIIANAYSKIYERKKFINFYNICMQSIKNIIQFVENPIYDYDYFMTFIDIYLSNGRDYAETYISPIVDVLHECILRDKEIIKKMLK